MTEEQIDLIRQFGITCTQEGRLNEFFTEEDLENLLDILMIKLNHPESSN